MKRFVFVATSGHETAFSIFDVSKSAKAIEFDFVKPVRTVERLRSAREAHWIKYRHLAHGGIVTEQGGPKPSVAQKMQFSIIRLFLLPASVHVIRNRNAVRENPFKLTFVHERRMIARQNTIPRRKT